MDRTYSYSFERNEPTIFHTWDYVIWGLTLFVSAAIGMYYAIKDRKKNRTDEFMLGGRNLSVFPVVLSLLSSFISAVTLLGTPAEVYLYDTMFWWITGGFILAALGAAHIFIPIFHRLQITSIFEYIELRFGTAVRLVSSVLYLVWMFFFMAIVLYGPSLALHAVTGLHLWGSVVAVGVVCTFYTALGGMKAVVWTDSLQMIVMFVGMSALLIIGSNKVGGMSEVWRIANEHGRIRFLDFNPDPTIRHTVWTVGIGSGFFWGSVYGINQAQVQRAISLPTVRKMKIAIWLNFPGFVFIQTLAVTVGLAMFAYFHTCDPVKLGIIHKTDQLVPLFTMDVLGHIPGLPGLVMSCVFSGTLSSISSGLTAIAAVTLKDFVKPFCWKNPTQLQETIFSKGMVLAVGGLCLVLAYVVSEWGAILQLAYLLFGILGGPLLGLFTLGILFPWANKWGGLIGHLTSLVLLLWIGVGTRFEGVVTSPKSAVRIDGCGMNLTSTTIPMTSAVNNLTTTYSSFVPVNVRSEPLAIYKLSYMWYSALATLVTVIVGLIVSFITGYTRPERVDPRLICPVFDELFPYLPERVRKPLRFGVKHQEQIPDNPQRGATQGEVESLSIEKSRFDNRKYNAEKQNGSSIDKGDETAYVRDKQNGGMKLYQIETQNEFSDTRL